MGVFDFLKKKDHQEAMMMGEMPAQAHDELMSHAEKPIGTPTQDVLNFRKQGYTDNQIVQTLQRQGYEPAQIYDALNQAELMGGVRQMPTQEAPQMTQQQQMIPGGPLPLQQPSEDFEEMLPLISSIRRYAMLTLDSST